MFGILTNMARMPMTPDGALDIMMGLQFHQHDWYKIYFWPLIARVDVMTPQKLTAINFSSPSGETADWLRRWCGRLLACSNKHIWKSCSCTLHLAKMCT